MTTWKFVDEAPRLAEHYSRQRYVYDDIDQSLQEDSASFDGAVEVWKISHSTHVSKNSTNRQRAVLEVPRYLESNPLGSSLVYCLESKVNGALIPLWLVGSFFQFVPARMGRSVALDDAVSCLCGIYSSPYSLDTGVYKGYAKALSSLRGCLSDDSLRMKSETLCASILLQMCEVSFVLLTIHQVKLRANTTDPVKLVVSADRGQWSNLAYGTTALLRSRGVHQYTSAFDHSMLESQLSVIVCSTYAVHILLWCAQGLLTRLLSVIVQSITEDQRTLFPAIARMAKLNIAMSELAFSERTGSSLEPALSTPCYSSQLAKLGVRFFEDTRGSNTSNAMG